MKSKYKIVISSHQDKPVADTRVLNILKAGILTVLALSFLIGISIAALVLGSAIAAVLVVLFALATIAWVGRRLFLGILTRITDKRRASKLPDIMR